MNIKGKIMFPTVIRVLFYFVAGFLLFYFLEDSVLALALIMATVAMVEVFDQKEREKKREEAKRIKREEEERKRKMMIE